MKKILTLIIALVFSLTLVTTSALAYEGEEVTDGSKTALTASFDAKEGENSTFTSSLKDTEAEKNTISLTSLSERYTSTADTEYCNSGIIKLFNSILAENVGGTRKFFFYVHLFAPFDFVTFILT